MKICGKCRQSKSLDEFWKNQTWCKSCSKERRRQYYLDNKAKEDARNKAALASLKQWAVSLKDGKSCVDCDGTFHHVAMDWEHPEDNKVANVSDLVRRGYSKASILAEIAKCELVCSNCHRVRTWGRSVEA